MGVLGNNIDRVKNIIAGKYGDKTKSSIGYQKKYIKHVEGDIWVENGKTWTIINGLKQTVTKLQTARESLLIPFCCPNCSKPLKHNLDKKAWHATKKCFDCNMQEQTEKQLDGTLSDYVKTEYKKNALAWLVEKRLQFESWLEEQVQMKGYVTQNGEVEDWSGGLDQSKLREQFESEYVELKKQIESI